MKFGQASLLTLTVFTCWLFAPIVAFNNNFRRRTSQVTASGSAGSDHLRPWVRAKILGEPEAGRSIHPNRRWKVRIGDVAIIPYKIDTSFKPDQKRMIVEAVQQFSDAVKVIKFIERTTELAFIQVIYDPAGGCSSPVGRQATGKSQDLYLGKLCFFDDAGPAVLGRIQHEFMHALGFEHEHVSIVDNTGGLSAGHASPLVHTNRLWLSAHYYFAMFWH